MYIGWQWCWPVVPPQRANGWGGYIKPATVVPQKEPCLCFKTPGITQLKEQNGGWPPSVHTWPSASLSVKNAELLVEATVHRSQECAGVCPCALLWKWAKSQHGGVQWMALLHVLQTMQIIRFRLCFCDLYWFWTIRTIADFSMMWHCSWYLAPTGNHPIHCEWHLYMTAWMLLTYGLTTTQSNRCRRFRS